MSKCVSALTRVMRTLHASEWLEIQTDAAPDHVFAGERKDLDEMLGNLVDNACKWAGRRVEIASRIGADGMLSITIDDDGPGLPEEYSEAALKPGVRLDESIPGTGLGLAVARDLAHLYGGDIRLATSPSADFASTCASLRPPRDAPPTALSSNDGRHHTALRVRWHGGSHTRNSRLSSRPAPASAA